MVLAIIIIICSLITATVGILQSRSLKRKDKAIWGLKRSALILILISVATISSSLSIINVYLENKKSKLLEFRENEKLTLIAYRAQGAIDPIMMFLSSYLSANGLDKPLTIFNENHEDEPGKDRPAPYLMNPITDVFSKSSLFQPSNMWVKGRQLTWIESLYQQLRESNYRCDLLIKHYGSVNHPLVVVMDELRMRSEVLIFLVDTAAKHAGMKKVWEKGISHEQHLDILRHYFLRMLKAKRIIRSILKTET